MKLTRKSDATRQNILNVGYRLVLSKGFSGLGLKELLKEAGVPKGSFYHYFPSKEAFGCQLLQDYVLTYEARMEELINTDGTGKDRLMRYWQVWLAAPELSEETGWAEECLVVKLGAEVADLSEDMRLILREGIEKLVKQLAKMIDQARMDGSLLDGGEPAELALMLYQMWLGAALLTKLTRSRAPMEQAFVATERLLACKSAKAEVSAINQ